MWEWFKTLSLFIVVMDKIAACSTENSLSMFFWKQRAVQYRAMKVSWESLSEVSGRPPFVLETLLFAQSRGIILTDFWAAKLHHFAVYVPSNQPCRFFLPPGRPLRWRLAVISTPRRFYLILHRPASSPEAGRWGAVMRFCVSARACLCCSTNYQKMWWRRSDGSHRSTAFSLVFSERAEKKNRSSYVCVCLCVCPQALLVH